MKKIGAKEFIICGDFNSIAPDDPVDMSGLPKRIKALVWSQGGWIPRNVIAKIKEIGLIDCFRKMNITQPGFTLPAVKPNARLDYFFVPASLQHKIVRCEVISDVQHVSDTSDHLPLLLEIDI